MTTPQAEEKARIRRVKADQAIQLAVQNKWHDAVTTNREILELFPGDVDAHNRLGKALMELGRYSEAREAYGKALAADPNNVIAKKNLHRLENLQDADSERAGGEKLDLNLFIAETGKTGYSMLHEPAEPAVLAKLTAGDRVDLRAQGGKVAVHRTDGDYLGIIEPKLGLRLTTLMEGGNTYVAAVQSATDSETRLVIRETYQHPSQAGKMSFPSKTAGGDFRAYTKDSLVRHDTDDYDEEAEDEDGEYGTDWGTRRPVDEEELAVDDEAENADEEE